MYNMSSYSSAVPTHAAAPSSYSSQFMRPIEPIANSWDRKPWRNLSHALGSFTWVALVVINSMAIAGYTFGGGYNLYIINLSLVGGEALFVYNQYPEYTPGGTESLTQRKILKLVFTFASAGVFNGLGIAGIAPFTPVNVGIAQLVTTVVGISFFNNIATSIWKRDEAMEKELAESIGRANASIHPTPMQLPPSTATAMSNGF